MPRRVALEALDEEPVDQRHRGQVTGSPAVSHFAADAVDKVGIEVEVEVLPDRSEGVIKESMHRRSLRRHGCGVTP